MKQYIGEVVVCKHVTEWGAIVGVQKVVVWMQQEMYMNLIK